MLIRPFRRKPYLKSSKYKNLKTNWLFKLNPPPLINKKLKKLKKKSNLPKDNLLIWKSRMMKKGLAYQLKNLRSLLLLLDSLMILLGMRRIKNNVCKICWNTIYFNHHFIKKFWIKKAKKIHYFHKLLQFSTLKY